MVGFGGTSTFRGEPPDVSGDGLYAVISIAKHQPLASLFYGMTSAGGSWPSNYRVRVRG